MSVIIALTIGFILDFIFGDPYWMPHPVRLMGSGIRFFDKKVRKIFPQIPAVEFVLGIVLSLILCFLSYGIPFVLLHIVKGWNWYFGVFLEGFFCYEIFAARSLQKESTKVEKSLRSLDLLNSRKEVSMIVGRDTNNLDEAGIIKATVETIAENTSDGVIAPLLFMAIGGAPLGFLYKAVNTMDSMIGYKKKEYYYFGKFPARLDDLLNFFPARISAIGMIFSSFLLRMHGKNAWKIYVRDRRNHKSPNSAQTEAVAAGALGIQLAGNASYFGIVVEKPTIGDNHRKVEIEDISRTNKLMYVTTIVLLILVLIIRGIVIYV